MVHLSGIEKGPVWDRNFTSPSPVVVGGVHTLRGKVYLHHISLWYISVVLRKVQSGTETLLLSMVVVGGVHTLRGKVYLHHISSWYISVVLRKGPVWDRNFTSLYGSGGRGSYIKR